jgi:hypothetical protein
MEDAQAFVARSKITFPMLWDPTFRSWQALRVMGQPAAMLLDGQGVRLGMWFGRFDAEEVLAHVGSG